MGRLDKRGAPFFLVTTLILASQLRQSISACYLILCLSAPCLGQPEVNAVSRPSSSDCGSIKEVSSYSKCLRISFEGELAAGQSFEQEFGGDLLLRLNPKSAVGGWTIEIVPKSVPEGEFREYVWVVTPPYHFWNVRYLDTSYGISPQESVQNSPREFHFVLDEKQYAKAAQLVDLVASSRPLSDTRPKEEYEREVRDASDALMRFPVSNGRLWILDSKIKASTGPKDPGSIAWLKFRVELQVPCDFAAGPASDNLTLDRSACGASQGSRGN